MLMLPKLIHALRCLKRTQKTHAAHKKIKQRYFLFNFFQQKALLIFYTTLANFLYTNFRYNSCFDNIKK
jgi:hypothetical protein